jgi:dihydroneopterin aldolase
MKLIVKNLRVYTSIGTHNWEKVIKRLVVIKIEIQLKDQQIVDYDLVEDQVKKTCQLKHHNYIEDLTARIKSDIVMCFNLEPLQVLVELKKPNIIQDLPYAVCRSDDASYC